MNSAAVDMGGMQGNRRFLIGVGVSIAVHVALMFAYRHTGTSLPAFEPEPPSSIAVRILPPPPPPPKPEVAPPPRAPAQPAAPRSARRSTPQPVIAVPASPGQDTPPDAFSVEPAPPATADDAPKFDMSAAKETARELAGRTKLGIEGTVHAQFPDPPLETETKAARAISRAKRPNCKDGLPGGLLAPLFLMMDKKDHGCKW